MSTASKQSARAQATVEALEPNEFSDLLQREFKPKTDQARDAVQKRRQDARRAGARKHRHRSPTMPTARCRPSSPRSIASSPSRSTRSCITRSSSSSRARGAACTTSVNNTETDEQLKIRVMCASKREVARSLKRHKGIGWDQSPLFKKIYEAEYGQFGGEPFGALIGDFHFDHSPPDVEMLGEMAKIAAAAHCPFIAGASPTVMQMDSWQELSNPRDLTKIFQNTEHTAWRSLRESEDARYIGLAMPRFLGAPRPTVPAPTRSTNSSSRKKPIRPRTTATPGPTRPMRWA